MACKMGRVSTRRRGSVCGVDVGLDGAETTVWAKIRGDGTIEVIDIIETKPANTGIERPQKPQEGQLK